MPRNEFEKMIREGRGKIYRRAERAAVSKSARKEKHKAIAALAKANVKAGGIGSFSLIYADPPWKWGHFAIIGLGRIEMRISQLKLKDTLLPSRRCDSLAALRRGAKATARLSGWVSRLPWLAPCTTGR
jgi:16S rRNA G966 N2-methylase RsmD